LIFTDIKSYQFAPTDVVGDEMTVKMDCLNTGAQKYDKGTANVKRKK
jgi:hypothetical protein